MCKNKRRIIKLVIASSIAIAVFTLSFVITLITTFNFDTWESIQSYANNFKPIQSLTVIPSIGLALSVLIFNVSIHYSTSEEDKIWSHIAMNMGLVYIGISIANYLIQLITVIPSIMNNSLSGLEKMVSGYPSSIFYALMGSYFLMCIDLFFVGLLFKKITRFFLFLASIGCVVAFTIGGIFSISPLMMIGAMCWILGTIIGMLLVGKEYVKKLK